MMQAALAPHGTERQGKYEVKKNKISKLTVLAFTLFWRHLQFKKYIHFNSDCDQHGSLDSVIKICAAESKFD